MNDDLISRQAVTDLIMETDPFWCEGMTRTIFDGINRLPSVDAVPVRHGKFIGTEWDGYADGYPVYDEWKCSECGCVFEEEEPTYRYCPNCGARMDEE